MSFVKENTMCYKCGDYGACHLVTSDNPIKGHLCDDCYDKRMRFRCMIVKRRLDSSQKVIVKKVLN